MRRLFSVVTILTVLLLSDTVVYAQPANDNPCGAIAIAVENTGCEPTTTYTYTNATATPGTYGGCINGTSDPDVWYKIVVPSNGQFTFQMAADPAETQSVLAYWYRGNDCNNQLTPLGSENNFSCFFSLPYSRTINNLTPGSTLYLRVYKPSYQINNTSGRFKLCISNNNTLSDEPCTAGFFQPESADPLGQICVPSMPFSWSGATLSAGIPNPDCIGNMNPSNIRDMWYKIRVPASGKIVINTAGNDGNYYFSQVFSAASCNAGFSQIACVLNGSISLTQPANSVLYVRVFPWSANILPNGNTKICVAARNDVPVSNNNYKVGIGIDSPFAKLDIVGTGIFRDKLTVAGDIETRGNLIVQGNIISKYGESKLPANSSMSGNLSLDSLLFNNRLGNHLSLYGGLGNVPQYGLGIQSGLLQMYSDAANSNIAFGYGNSIGFTERARVINSGETAFRANGRLQLQTGTQSAGLWLANAANTANTAFIGLANDNQVGLFGNNGAGWGLTMNTANGNVGIGLNGAAAQAPLQFSNALGLTKISLYKGTYGDVGIGVYGGELRLQNDIPGGKVSMGVIETNGTFSELAKAQRNGAYAFSIFGSLWANGTTYASDGRFKKNIEPLHKSLEKVLQLQGVSYEMKTAEFPNEHFDSAQQVGLIAQDVEKIVPEVVTEGPNGYKAIDYAKLVPLLIESIKAQQAMLLKQQAEIDALKKKKH